MSRSTETPVIRDVDEIAILESAGKKPPMRVAFTGTREGMTPEQKKQLRILLKKLKPICLIHGGCCGADNEADQIACDLSIQRIIFPSIAKTRIQDSVFRNRNGACCSIAPPDEPLKRDTKIVKAADHLIACPKTPEMIVRSGTWATVRRGVRFLGVENVTVIKP